MIFIAVYSILFIFNIHIISSASNNTDIYDTLVKIKSSLQRYVSNLPLDNQCLFQPISESISTVGDTKLINILKDYNKLLNDDILFYPPTIVNTNCLHHNSIGNALSEYMEIRICAHLAKVHYINVSPSVNSSHSLFLQGFADIVVNPDPVSNYADAIANVQSICRCKSICHEYSLGLMHHHMDLAASIFRQAIDAYFNFKQKPINFLIVSENQLVSAKHGSNVINPKKIEELPFIPDVSIHYRCGDNLVHHYGFLRFRTLKKFIPQNASTVYIMAENPKRNVKFNSLERCSQIFDALSVYLENSFPTTNIVISRGGDISHDLVRLTYSKISICSVSTFCLWPAISNKNAVYFPVSRLILKEDIKVKYNEHFNWMYEKEDSPLLGKEIAQMSIGEVIALLSK